MFCKIGLLSFCIGQTQLLNCCHGNAHGNLNIRGISNHCRIDYDLTTQFEFGVIVLKKIGIKLNYIMIDLTNCCSIDSYFTLSTGLKVETELSG